jgi:hypothetical protein
VGALDVPPVVRPGRLDWAVAECAVVRDKESEPRWGCAREMFRRRARETYEDIRLRSIDGAPIHSALGECGADHATYRFGRACSNVDAGIRSGIAPAVAA